MNQGEQEHIIKSGHLLENIVCEVVQTNNVITEHE